MKLKQQLSDVNTDGGTQIEGLDGAKIVNVQKIVKKLDKEKAKVIEK